MDIILKVESREMTALTPAERQKRRRDKKAKDGLIKVELFLSPDDAARVRAYADKLKK